MFVSSGFSSSKNICQLWDICENILGGDDDDVDMFCVLK